jgi:drug/metabolite transporter (DMT)-like permease
VSSAGGPRRLIVTGSGTRSEAYSALDWGLLATTSLIWGASFFFIAVGLRALEPGVIAAARVMLGAGALALFRRSRVSIAPEDWGLCAMKCGAW